MEIKEKVIIEFLKQNTERQGAVLILDTLSGIEWDEMIVAGPYIDFEEIESETAYELENFPNTIKHHDSFILIGFLNKKRGVNFMEIPIALLPSNVFEQSGNNYAFYTKENSNLNL